MIDRDRTRVWCRTCVGDAAHKLGELLKNKCGGQPEDERDREKVLYRTDKLEAGCAPTKQTESLRLKVHNGVFLQRVWNFKNKK